MCHGSRCSCSSEEKQRAVAAAAAAVLDLISSCGVVSSVRRVPVFRIVRGNSI
jgi:hypothetical protein